MYADSASRTRPSRITRARLSPTPSTACRSVAAGAEERLEGAEVLDKPISEVGRQAVDLRHLPEAAARDMTFQVHVVREAGCTCDMKRIQQFVGVEMLQARETDRR